MNPTQPTPPAADSKPEPPRFPPLKHPKPIGRLKRASYAVMGFVADVLFNARFGK